MFHADLGPNFRHDMYPGAIALYPLSQNTRDNFTEACLKALLDGGMMAFSDRRTNSVLIPTSGTEFSDRLLQIIQAGQDKSLSSISFQRWSLWLVHCDKIDNF
jgi:hypothetical protein